MSHEHSMELRCQACGHRKSVGLGQMVDHLRNLGLFKRLKEPEPQLVQELYGQQIPFLTCGACGAVGYDQQDDADELDDELWGQQRKCEKCRQPIPDERLEVFPDTRRCTTCQQSADSGQDESEQEYCPRCGAIMSLKLRGGAGITAYAMSCSDCGYR